MDGPANPQRERALPLARPPAAHTKERNGLQAAGNYDEHAQATERHAEIIQDIVRRHIASRAEVEDSLVEEKWRRGSRRLGINYEITVEYQPAALSGRGVRRRGPDRLGRRPDLDIGVPVDCLMQPIRACLSGESDRQDVVVDAVTRRGKSVKAQVDCAPLVGHDQDRLGVILWMDEV